MTGNGKNHFKDLLQAVKKFGVDTCSETKEAKKTKTPEEKKLETEGLDIDISDVFSTDEGNLFVILKNGSVKKAVIHIVDISSWKVQWGDPRFHIHSCEKIQEMQAKGKNHRYRASSRKDGKFYIIKENKKLEKALSICSYCLTEYNAKLKCNETKTTFPLKSYLKAPVNHSRFSNIPLDECTIPNTYMQNWPIISKKMKERVKYKCSLCKGDFSHPECRGFLDTHHINSNKRDNTSENLQVLCIQCHSKQYNHNHIKTTNRYREYLKSHCHTKNERGNL